MCEIKKYNKKVCYLGNKIWVFNCHFKNYALYKTSRVSIYLKKEIISNYFLQRLLNAQYVQMHYIEKGKRKIKINHKVSELQNYILKERPLFKRPSKREREKIKMQWMCGGHKKLKNR